jgi:hypothetical protein
MKRLMQMFWIKMFWAAACNLPWQKQSAVGARPITELTTARTQVTLIVWDLTNPKYAVTYSREELVNMLELVRRCEREMGWKVPEPEAGGES